MTVSNNGVDREPVEGTGAVFAYVPRPEVDGAEPRTLTWHEGATVTVRRRHLAPRARGAVPTCSFGDGDGDGATAVVPATVLDDGVFACPVPALLRGEDVPAALEVRASANGGADLSASSATVTVYPPPALLEVRPDWASETAGADVVVRGAHFHPAAGLACWFEAADEDGDGSHESVAATCLSPTEVACRAPPARRGPARLWVSTTDDARAGRSANALDFIFRPGASLTSVAPARGAAAGGTVVVVRGEGFRADVSGAACRFGTVTVPATVLDADRLRCVAPPAAAAGAAGGAAPEQEEEDAAVVSLEVSADGGHEFTASGVAFRYFRPRPIKSMAPHAGPRGGGTRIAFRGAGIGRAASAADAGPLDCRFHPIGSGDAAPLPLSSSPVAIVDEDALACTTPALVAPAEGLSDIAVVAAFRVAIAARDGGESPVVVLADGDDGDDGDGATPFVFSFLPAPTLAALRPPGGTARGGTWVEVEGTGFVRRDDLTCRFDGTASPATRWISATRIACLSPPASSRRRALPAVAHLTLGIRDDDGEEALTADRLPYTYLPASRVASFAPTFGSADGGTRIRVRGSSFAELAGLPPQCWFSSSDAAAAATVWSDTLVECTLPPMAASERTSSVGVSFNGGADVFSADQLFTYVRAPKIDAVSPHYISTNGSNVTITGDNFGIPHEHLVGVSRCSFGGIVVAATIETENMMTCIAPPRAKPGLVELAISMNGVDFAPADEITYHLPLEIHDVVPPFALETGGASIAVKGAHFPPDLSCVFHVPPEKARSTLAAVESAELLACPVPPGAGGGHAATLELSVTGGRSAENPRAPFRYHQLISISSVTPDGGEVVLEANGVRPSQEDLVCGFSLLGHKESEPSPMMAQADVLSPGVARCLTPALGDHYTGNLSVTLGVTHNGIFHDLTDSQAELTSFSAHSAVESVGATDGQIRVLAEHNITVEPTVVSEIGRSILSMVTDLETSDDATCLFSPVSTYELPRTAPGGTPMSGPTGRSPAFIVTKHEIHESGRELESRLLTCQTPRMPPGEYLLSLETSSLNVPEIAVVTVHRAFSVFRFEPSSGHAGTNLTIHGSNIPNVTGLSCKIGSSIARATLISLDTLQCSIPLDHGTSTPLPFDDYVSISANGQDFEEIQGFPFTYTARPQISEVFPAGGASTGGTALTISGKHLLPNDPNGGIILSFGEVLVPGVPLNETAVTCMTPSIKTEDLSLPVLIRVSTNGGYDFSHEAVTFLYRTFSIATIVPSQGPERGGNPVTIFGSGFAASSLAVCRFGESTARARYISEEEIECIAPKSAGAPSVVDVSLTLASPDWTSSSQSYVYLPMLRIYDMSPPRLPTNVPHHVQIFGESFQYPSELMCKLGDLLQVEAVVIGNHEMTCFLPPIHQPGDITLDIVDQGGYSMLENSLDTSIVFYDPVHFRIAPSFGSVIGGTVVTASSISNDWWRNDPQVMCRFVITNEPSLVIDTAAMPLNGTLLSCVTPNVTNIRSNDDDHIYAAVSLVSRGLSLPLSLTFPFMFKKLPAVKSSHPTIGKAGTLVRVTGDSSGIWLNSSLLACVFGQEKTKAIWIAPSVVDCIAPVSHNVSTIVTVTDNGGDTSESNSMFSFYPDPVVTSVEPRFGLSLDEVVVTLFGNGFSSRDVPACGFVVGNDTKNVLMAKGRAINETAMECLVPSNTLAPSNYRCVASNNGGIDWGLAGVNFRFIHPPSIISLSPQSGIASAFSSVAVSGTNLVIEQSQHTHCILFDHAGSQMGSGLAEQLNDTLLNCPVQCPSSNTTAMYSLAVSLSNVDQAHTSSMASFWCHPPPSFVDVNPRLVAVGEPTQIKTNVVGLGSITDVDCIFESIDQMVTVQGNITGSVVECLTPRFDRPQRVTLQVNVAPSTSFTSELHIEVVDPILPVDIFPKTVFVGSDVRITGSNLAPDKLACKVVPLTEPTGGRVGKVIATEESDEVRCLSANFKASLASKVSLYYKDAPQITAVAGMVEIRPTPRVLKVTPSSGLTHGGTNIIIRGINFHATESPLCFFGEIKVSAYILTKKSIACITPKSQAGKFQVRVSLDGENTFQGDHFFTFFTPIMVKTVYPRVVINDTMIILRGERFRFDLPIQCSFGGTTSAQATVISSTEATCKFVATTEDFGRASVSLVTSDNVLASFGVSDLSVLHHPLVEISSAEPLYGSLLGGQSFELHVSGSSEATKERFPIHCQFGDKVTLTTFDESLVSCTTPPSNAPGNVSLSLSYNGLPLSSNSLVFEYTFEPKVYAINPAHGSYNGGSSVRIHGVNLMPRSKVSCRCRFGQHESYGYFGTTENSALYCITPRVNYTSSQTLYLKLDPIGKWIDTLMDFHFLEPMEITSIAPLEFDHGVELIRVKGQGFSTEMDLACRFETGEHVDSEAIILSNTTLHCPLPWEAMAGFGSEMCVFLSITSNGVDFVQSPSCLTYKRGDDIAIRSLSPGFGPAFGSSAVDVYGTGFQEHANLTCWFGKVGTQATFISANHVQCLSTPVYIKESERVAHSYVSVTHEASLPPVSGRSFIFYSHPSTLHVHPTHGVTTGGTQIKLENILLADITRELHELDAKITPLCRFDTTSVPATVELEALVCISPPIETQHANATKAVRLSVSLNGKDFIFTQRYFHYFDPPSVHTILPEIIWIDEPTTLVIQGSNFIPLDHASCLVDGARVPAEVISGSEIRCHVQLTQTLSNEFVPVALTLNGDDVSNVIPVSCWVHMPSVTSAHPLFVSNEGGTIVHLNGYGFEKIKGNSFVKLTGTNTTTTLHVVDNETASFRSPSSNGQDSTMILISYGSSSFTDTGFELQYLPHLSINSIVPPYLFANKQSRVNIAGNFNKDLTYNCVLLNADDLILEVTAEYRNERMLVCDIFITSHGFLSLGVRRKEDNQTSNKLNVIPTPHCAIQDVQPSSLSETEAKRGGQLLSITVPRKFTSNCSIGDPFHCRFIDEVGQVSMTPANITDANRISCVFPPLTGAVEVSLAKDDLVLSNPLSMHVLSTSRVLHLTPDSGPLNGGTHVKVHGVGFAAYSEAKASCKIECRFGNELSTATVVDDETIFCSTPSYEMAGDVPFVLVQSSPHAAPTNISSSDTTFLYYWPPKLVACYPDSGPASGDTKILCQVNELHGEGFSRTGSPFQCSFSSIANESRVAYSNTVEVVSESTLAISSPPSPLGSKGGAVTIRLSRNGQDFSSHGLYYNYTESTFIQSVHPHQVTEGSCFNLTLLVDNLFSSQVHGYKISIGGQVFPANQDLVLGTINCELCLDLHEGYHQVGLLSPNGVFTNAGLDLEVKLQIKIAKVTPPIGPTDGRTSVTVEGEEFDAWDDQLYCFFGSERQRKVVPCIS